MPFYPHYNIFSNTFLIINLLNQQVSVPHPLYLMVCSTTATIYVEVCTTTSTTCHGL